MASLPVVAAIGPLPRLLPSTPSPASAAAALATASIPIYIHLPSFAASRLGLTLGQVGTILLAIRMVDFLQDPLLGWMTDRYSHRIARLASAGLIALSVGSLMVFAIAPIGPVALWLVAGLLVTFTGYSLGTILLYGQSATFAANALAKARDAAAATGLPAIADDSGITVDALNGMPGIFSARWSGRHGDDEANLQLLLGQTTDVPDERRGAAFVCAAALVTPDAATAGPDPDPASGFRGHHACRCRPVGHARACRRARLVHRRRP